MSRLVISEGIVIDEIQNVLIALQNAGRRLKDGEIIKTFVNKEVNTKFYMDDKLNSFMDNEPGSTYLWLDTGFVDFKNETIFVSLHRSMSGFSGHMTGTAKFLAETMKKNNHRAKSYIDSNYSKFRNKYINKIKERDFQHITDINGFLIAVNNKDSSASGNPFAMLNLADFAVDEPVKPLEIVKEPEVCDETPAFNKFEEDITISLLLDNLDKMNDYIEVLQDTIKELQNEKLLSSKKIEELEEKKKDYERNFVQMRLAMQNQEDVFIAEEVDATKRGHNLVSGYSKILVLGACDIGANVMQGIAKNYFGFEKSDIDFETDYYKSMDVAGRLLNGSKYKIVILGAMPHSVKGKGDDSSIVTALKNNSNVPIVCECRSKSGELKVTRESFKNALSEVCQKLEQDESIDYIKALA